MNIQITNPNKYSNVIKVWNYGATLVDDNRIDGHLYIRYKQLGCDMGHALFGITRNIELEEEYGFKFVSNENNIDNGKYYF